MESVEEFHFDTNVQNMVRVNPITALFFLYISSRGSATT
jgi:hypothetical protein